MASPFFHVSVSKELDFHKGGDHLIVIRNCPVWKQSLHIISIDSYRASIVYTMI